MNFRPTTDPRNWRTRSRSALTARGQVLHLSQSADKPDIHLGEFTLTPDEALALAAELLNAATQMRPTTETTR